MNNDEVFDDMLAFGTENYSSDLSTVDNDVYSWLLMNSELALSNNSSVKRSSRRGNSNKNDVITTTTTSTINNADKHGTMNQASMMNHIVGSEPFSSSLILSSDMDPNNNCTLVGVVSPHNANHHDDNMKLLPPDNSSYSSCRTRKNSMMEIAIALGNYSEDFHNNSINGVVPSQPILRNEGHNMILDPHIDIYSPPQQGEYNAHYSSNGISPTPTSTSMTTATSVATTATSGGNITKRNKPRKVSSTASSLARRSKSVSTIEKEKRQQRLEKNREIARNCRKRKRQRMEELEEEVKRLQASNEEMYLQLNRGKCENKENTKSKILEKIKSLVDGKKSEKEINVALSEYHTLFSDCGKERKTLVKYHLDQLKKLVLPTQETKMSMWALQQEDNFYNEKVNSVVAGAGIWNILCENMQLSNLQKKQILSCRDTVREQKINLGDAINALDNLDEKVTTNLVNVENMLGKIMEILKPSQQASFLLWIEQNQTCMHMLNNMWQVHDSNQTSLSNLHNTTTNTANTTTSINKNSSMNSIGGGNTSTSSSSSTTSQSSIKKSSSISDLSALHL
jgi:hypothetical protein